MVFQKKKLKKYGAVSEEIAKLMAYSAAIKGNANIGVGITGIAGPGGATKTKKVGEVYIALSVFKNKKFIQNYLSNLPPNKGTREDIRLSSVDCALDCLLNICKSKVI